MTDKKGTDDQAGNDPRNNGNSSTGQPVGGPGAHKSAATDANPSKDKKAEAASSGAQPKADKPADSAGRKTAADDAQPPKAAVSSQAETKKAEQKQPDPKSGAQKQPEDTRPNAGSKRKADAPAAATPQPAAGNTLSGGSGRNGGGNESRKGGKLAAVIAIIALLVALVALVGAAWIWHRSELRTAEFSARINTLQGDLEDSVRGQVQSQVAGIRSRIEDVASANAQQAQTLSNLQSALQSTRLQMAGMAQQMQGSVRRWQVQQIEQLLITANRRLQLYNEPAQASAALKLASQAIARLNDPRLFEVRKRIVDNIAALDALPSPDIEGMALTLSAFIDQVPDLPLASDVPANYEPQDASGANGGSESGIDLSAGWQHFVDSVGTALHSMVTIRRADGTQAALLPPDQVYFLTQNLMLELRAARLALLEGNSTLYRESLSTAIAWLKQYFDTSAPGVKSMIDRLGQMQNVKLDWQAPDITGSLFALRDYMQARSAENSARQQQAEGQAASSGGEQGSGQQGSQQGSK